MRFKFSILPAPHGFLSPPVSSFPVGSTALHFSIFYAPTHSAGPLLVKIPIYLVTKGFFLSSPNGDIILCLETHPLTYFH